MLKLSKCGNLVKRRLPFKMAPEMITEADSRTIYVENFPSTLSHMDLATIFKRAGSITNVMLPSKDFCFIEFDSTKSMEQACSLFNNLIPEELTNPKHKNFIRVSGDVAQFLVMSKNDWKAYK
jgi:RNA recognition motif-containing protein